MNSDWVVLVSLTVIGMTSACSTTNQAVWEGTDCQDYAVLWGQDANASMVADDRAARCEEEKDDVRSRKMNLNLDRVMGRDRRSS